MKISRVGYARCPGCLCHVKVTDGTTDCPFCGDELRHEETIGSAAMEKLRNSRTALLAMGLAGGVTFAVACGEPEPKPAPDNNPTSNDPNNIDPQNDYGGFDPGENNPTGTNGGADMGVQNEEDLGFVDPGNDYGGFDPGD